MRRSPGVSVHPCQPGITAFPPLFVYIPHDPCPLSTTALWSVPTAGQITFPLKFNAMTAWKAAPMLNSTAGQSPLGDGLQRTTWHAGLDWRFLPTTTRDGSPLTWELSRRAVLRFHSTPHCTPIRY